MEIVEVEVGAEALNKGNSMIKESIEIANNVIIVRSLDMCKQIARTRRNK